MNQNLTLQFRLFKFWVTRSMVIGEELRKLGFCIWNKWLEKISNCQFYSDSKEEWYNGLDSGSSANLIATVQCSGMNYTLITDNLIVGSQPQKPEDIDHLREVENVAYILNLQQDKDVEYWGIDLQSIINRCKEVGIRHMRRPVSRFFLALFI